MGRVPVIALSWGASLALALTYLSIGWGLDQLLAGRPPSDLRWGAAGAVASGLCAWWASRLGGDAMGPTETSLRHRVLDQVFALGPTERTRERAGRLVNTATDGVERAAAHRATFASQMIASLATPALVVLVIGATIDWVAAGLLAIAIPVVPLAIGSFQMAFRSVSTRYRASSRALSAQELDAIQGLSTLALLNAQDSMGERLARATEDVRRHVMRYLAGNQLVLLVVDCVFSLGMTTGAVAAALWREDAGAITPGQALALVLLSSIMLDPLDRIGQFFYIGMGGIAAGKEIARFTAQTPTVTDAPGVRVPQREPAPGRVALQAVAFSYDEGVPVLNGIDLDVEAGESVVLTGASGEGKSTISALIQGMRRPDSGRVLVGGEDLRDVPLSWARERIGVVEQTTYLFSGSLRDNLAIARYDATDAEMLAALRTARLGDLLDRLPEGLDTAVGERGLSLSGGEVQRVAIARALLKDAPILLLDEPTAHVDLTSEREILHALDDASKGRTTLTISHRAATIADADRRIELRDGALA